MSSPNRVLLLGAGFSHNWGGWLASDFAGNLLDQPEVDDYIRGLLLRTGGGFEAVLDQLQLAQDPRLVRFEQAIRRTYADMNGAYLGLRNGLNFSNDIDALVTKYLAQFDAIFTLNQDELIELHYLSASPELLASSRLDGTAIPGMRRDPASPPSERIVPWVPHEASLSLAPRIQPYIKLHGSSNWRSESGSLLVIGGNKASAIAQHSVLRWGWQRFEEYLSKPDTRLVVVGYGFRDRHINKAIVGAGASRNLQLYLVNPHGLDAANWECSGGSISAKSSLYESMAALTRGTSSWDWSRTFGGHGAAERLKLARWLGP